MRDKELRIALVCYGGVSLAVYMHGVTKEVWRLAQASRAFRNGEAAPAGSSQTYHALLARIREEADLRLRVFPDILTGASAGGMNAIFLSQALLTGQSLDPLTRLWLERADSDVLLSDDARPENAMTKFWAQPLVSWTLRRPGNAVSRTVAKETRAELRGNLSRLMRSRWFAPPFSGIGFSRLIDGALQAMAAQPAGPPLIPWNHPIDLFVTATDFRGHRVPLAIHSPPRAIESEHRLPISFRARGGQKDIAARPELVLAARATASFPGAFPPLEIDEIDRLCAEGEVAWVSRDAFLARVMPHHVNAGTIPDVALIDGAVLVGAPFAEAIAALPNRPASREIDRRFVYIDPRPDLHGGARRDPDRRIGFFGAIFGALSVIPREQPIRDDLERIAAHTREAVRLRAIVESLRPEVEQTVDKLMGRTLFLDRPNPDRLTKWRAKAQQAAAMGAGFAFHGYAQAKFAAIVEALARLVRQAINGEKPTHQAIVAALTGALEKRGLERLGQAGGGANEAAIGFFRDHDIQFRIRRLRLLLRRLEPGDIGGSLDSERRDAARTAVYEALALYTEREQTDTLGAGFSELAAEVLAKPGAVLDAIADRRNLRMTDPKVDALLAGGLSPLPRKERRQLLLAYLGFPFYDIATLPLLGARGLDEFDPILVDRISPDDATSIREGGAAATLRGIEFYNFGAFFSRAYRENDYLWGRLHGAERMIDITASTLTPDQAFPSEELARFKKDAFVAILQEERASGQCDPGLIDKLRREVEAKLG